MTIPNPSQPIKILIIFGLITIKTIDKINSNNKYSIK